MFLNFHKLNETIKSQIVKEFQILREGFILDKNKYNKQKENPSAKPLRRESLK